MVCVTHDDVLQDLGKKGLKNLVVVPLSFVSEHVETLEEIDIEYREVANEVLSLSLSLSPPPPPPVYTHVSQSFTRAMTDI
jgi:protoheme ferro-lyase